MDPTQKYKTITNRLISEVNGKNILTNPAGVVADAMSVVDKEDIPGSDKKSIVIEALKLIIGRFVTDEAIAKVIVELLPSMIETIIDVSKNIYEINKKEKCCTPSYWRLLCCRK